MVLRNVRYKDFVFIMSELRVSRSQQRKHDSGIYDDPQLLSQLVGPEICHREENKEGQVQERNQKQGILRRRCVHYRHKAFVEILNEHFNVQVVVEIQVVRHVYKDIQRLYDVKRNKQHPGPETEQYRVYCQYYQQRRQEFEAEHELVGLRYEHLIEYRDFQDVRQYEKYYDYGNKKIFTARKHILEPKLYPVKK
jgi:arginyl-tRNA--protein-N-Asp/Glu arginylyltransferase